MIKVLSQSQLVRLVLCGVAVFALCTLSLTPSSRHPSTDRFRGLDLKLLFPETESSASGPSLGKPMLHDLLFGTSNVSANASLLSNATKTIAPEGKLGGSEDLRPREAALPAQDGNSDTSTEPAEGGSEANATKPARNLLGFRENGTSTAVPLSQITRRKSGVRPKLQGYLMSIEYQQQFLGAFKGFTHLAQIASHLNLSIVEPYAHGSSLSGVPEPVNGPGVQVMKLSHFYDLYHLREAFKTCTESDLVTLDTFLEKASRHIVFVSFLTSLGEYEPYFPKFEEGARIKEVSGYTKDLLISLGRLNAWGARSFARRRQRHPHRRFSAFKKARAILIDARPLHNISWEYVIGTLQNITREQVERYGSATVVLRTWRDVQPQDMISSFFYSITGFPWYHCNDIANVPHSKHVVKAAETLSNNLKSIRPVIGVHIRAERLLIDYKGSVEHYMSCLHQLKLLLQNGSVPKVPRESVHVFHDLGRYGSQTCTDVCLEGRTNFLTEIEGLGYPIVFFEPATLGYIPMRMTLSAFVDREYLTRVDVLVTVGRGAYQQNIVDRFLYYSGGRQENLHKICNNTHPVPVCYPNC
jgi:hypothetical protein